LDVQKTHENTQSCLPGYSNFLIYKGFFCGLLIGIFWSNGIFNPLLYRLSYSARTLKMKLPWQGAAAAY